MKNILIISMASALIGCSVFYEPGKPVIVRPNITNEIILKKRDSVKVTIPALPAPPKHSKAKLAKLVEAHNLAKINSTQVAFNDFVPAADDTNILFDEFVFGGRNWVSVRWGSNTLPVVNWGITVDSMPNLLFTTGCSATGVDRWTLSFPTNFVFITATNVPCAPSTFAPAEAIRYGETKAIQIWNQKRMDYETRILTRVVSGFNAAGGVRVYVEKPK